MSCEYSFRILKHIPVKLEGLYIGFQKVGKNPFSYQEFKLTETILQLKDKDWPKLFVVYVVCLNDNY